MRGVPARRGRAQRSAAEGKAFPSLSFYHACAIIKNQKLGESTMPMIEAKVTMQLPAEKRDVLKAEFGKAISIMGTAGTSKPQAAALLME